MDEKELSNFGMKLAERALAKDLENEDDDYQANILNYTDGIGLSSQMKKEVTQQNQDFT